MIPPRFEPHHGPTMVKSMTGECVITRSVAVAQAGPDLSYRPAEQVTLFEGACRVQQLSAGDGQTILGDQALNRVSFLITTPLDQPRGGVLPGDVVTITATTDGDLAGQHLTVVSPVTGTVRVERDIYAVSDTPAGTRPHVHTD